MTRKRYPPQDPLSPLGEAYQARILELGSGISGEEIAYGPDPYQSLTVFRPQRHDGDVLVFFHGGGWTNGYKEWMHFMAPAFTGRGVVFVSAGYRLAPAHVFPAGLEDCADALACVWRHAASFGADADRVFVGGHSAGGHYAALLAVTSGWRAARGLPPQLPRGCLPVSGVYRFGADSGMAARPRFLGTVADGRAELAAAPLEQLEPATCPPFFLSHGSRDFPHLVRQAEQMVGALKAAGVPVHREVLEDCDHFEASIACGDPARAWVASAVAWMRAVANSP
jgi:acetyl esterase/lipase